MFSGIIEDVAKVVAIQKEGSNVHFTLSCSFIKEVYIDQSIAHNGVCLTLVDIQSKEKTYKVTAIEETLKRSNLSHWKVGDWVNVERSMKLGDRLDGHIVQGHVDTMGTCEKVELKDGSWNFFFTHPNNPNYLTVEKGSITINGVSLTVVDSGKNNFSVSIIPYTYEHTNFKHLKEGDWVNLEFDILGKYFAKHMAYHS